VLVYETLEDMVSFPFALRALTVCALISAACDGKTVGTDRPRPSGSSPGLADASTPFDAGDSLPTRPGDRVDAGQPQDAGNFDDTVDAGQARAVIVAGATQNVGYLVAFSGSQSVGTNPFGEVDVYGIQNYAWTFGDGTAGETSNYLTTTTHRFESAGTYTVRLTVTDYTGAKASTSTEIEVGTLPRRTATGGAIAAAIDALGGAPGIVTVPAGTFSLGIVKVPAGVVIEGAGAGQTKLVGVSFYILGDNVRITGIEADGQGKADDNAFSAYGTKNLLVDHSDWHHYQQAAVVAEYASATFEDNFIHDHDYAGLGYGIEIAGGSWAMVRRNRFERNRHSVAAGGKTGSVPSEYVSLPTGYDLIDNTVTADAVNNDVTIDMHPTGHGRIRIVGNRFTNVAYGLGLFDGWGEVRNNTFKKVEGYCILSRRPVHNGNFIPSAGVFRLDIVGNTFVESRNYYQIEYGKNISIEGKAVSPPYTGDAPPP
jgi:PKD repeat protein